MKKAFIVGLVILLSVIVLTAGAFSENKNSKDSGKRILSDVTFISPVHETIYLLSQDQQPQTEIKTNVQNTNTKINTSISDSQIDELVTNIIKDKIKDSFFYNSEKTTNTEIRGYQAWVSEKTTETTELTESQLIESQKIQRPTDNEEFKFLGNRASKVETAIESKTGIITSLILTGDIKNNKDDLEIISYSQEYQGIPVFNSKVTLVKKGQEVVLATYNIYNIKDLSTRPEINEEQAIGIAEEDTGLPYETDSFTREGVEKESDSNQPVLRIFEGRLSWQITSNGFLYFIDAQIGDILSKQSLVRFVSLDVNGTVKGRMYAHDPTQLHELVPFEDDSVFVQNTSGYRGSGTTNGSGYYAVYGLVGSNFTVYSFLMGPYADVYNEVAPGGYYAVFSNTSVPNGSTVDWNWTAPNDNSTNESESNVFYHMNRIHDYFNNGTAPFNLDEVDYSLKATVEASMYYDCGGGASNCNACFVPGGYGVDQLFFGNGSGTTGCNNTALGSDIIYHEYTHWVTDSVYNNSPVLEYALQPGAMSEGFSDYFATTINNNPMQGDKILPASWVRYLNNSYVYPDNFSYEVHDDSLMFSGALWDFRQLVGNATAEKLYMYVMQTTPTTFTEFLDYTLLFDEILNGGNLNMLDGTPNSTNICTAFYANHGIFSDFCAYYADLLSETYDNDTSIAIPDYDSGQGLRWVNSTITIPAANGTTINDLQVYVDVSEAFTYDTLIKLIAPNGTEVTLFNGSGIQGAGGCWNPWAPVIDGRGIWSYYYSSGYIAWWFDKELPPDGIDCNSVTDMDVFNGMQSNGTWKLSVADTWAGGAGTINEFALQVYSDEYISEAAPVVTIQSPLNTTYTTNVIDIDYNAIDEDSTPVDKCWYSLNNGVTNTTLASCDNITLTQAAGPYHLIIWANDTATPSNNGSDDVYYTVTRPTYGCVGATWTYTCGNYIPESCILNRNLNYSGICFTVAASGLTISGGNATHYNITGNRSVYGDGIDIVGYNGTIITNFSSITNFSTGIYIYSANFTLNNSVIEENELYDIEFAPDSIDDCASKVINTNGSGGKPIVFNGSTAFTNVNGNYSEIILCDADNSSLSGTRVQASSVLDNNGIFVYYTNNSNFTNVTSSNNYQGFYLYNSSGNNLKNSFANNNSMRGIYITDGANNYVYNNTLKDNAVGDFLIMVSDEEYCVNNVSTNTGSDDLPILYNYTNTTIEDRELSELELCGADNSSVDNVTIGSGMYIINTDGSNFTNIVSEENYYGILNYGSNNNTFVNCSLDNNTLGFYQYNSNFNTVQNVNASNNSLGIYSTTDQITFENRFDNVNASNNTIMGILSQWDIGGSITDSIMNSNRLYGIYVTVAGANISGNTINSNFIGLAPYWTLASNFNDNTASSNTFYDFYSVLDDGVSTVHDLNIGGPIISFVPVDVGIVKKTDSPGDNPSGYGDIDKFINVTSLSGSSQISLNVSYLASEISGLQESTFKMFLYDSSWAELRDSGVDTSNDRVYSGAVTSFGIFAPMAQTSGGSTGPGGGGGGGGGGAPSVNGTVFDVGDLSNYDNGVTTSNVGQYDKISFILDSTRHTLTVKSVLADAVVVEIASTPITVTLPVNKPYNLDLNGDGINDISVRLNSLSELKASITLSEIAKPIVTNEGGTQKSGGQGINAKIGGVSLWIYIIVLAIVVVVLVIVIIVSSKNKKSQNKKR
ncbi:MAG: proprotein convertase P-domain-containing protein [Candidatus Pacearchaeota archaeon]|nr:proprotein convertase P-domain-containing protein [Candidatus Pacearchaeota archaeon]